MAKRVDRGRGSRESDGVLSLQKAGGLVLARFMKLIGRLFELGVVALVITLVWFAVSGSPYSDRDPDLSWLRAKLDQFESGATAASIDLSRLNEGDWAIACLFGGYTHPTDRIQKLGGSLSFIDRLRFFALSTLTLRFGEVEEYEVVIAYVDKGGRAEFLFFDKTDVQHGEYCTKQPQTTLAIGGYPTDWDTLKISN
jgi:hypothetical protein